MLQVFTTKFKSNGEKGNCLAAALASVLEIDLIDVPQFEEMTRSTWKSALFDWADLNGYIIEFTNERPAGYGVGVGVHPDGGLHAVVVFNGEFYFDTNGTDVFYQEHRYYIKVSRRNTNIETYNNSFLQSLPL